MEEAPLTKLGMLYLELISIFLTAKDKGIIWRKHIYDEEKNNRHELRDYLILQNDFQSRFGTMILSSVYLYLNVEVERMWRIFWHLVNYQYYSIVQMVAWQKNSWHRSNKDKSNVSCREICTEKRSVNKICKENQISPLNKNRCSLKRQLLAQMVERFCARWTWKLFERAVALMLVIQIFATNVLQCFVLFIRETIYTRLPTDWARR